MAECQRVKTCNTKKARPYRDNFHQLAASSIKDFLSEVPTEVAFFWR